jgi:folate-dependent phosphoribosylglycinamide formyltransferase PurN
MKEIVILTGNELRHQFFRKLLASFSSIDVVHSYCEVTQDINKVLIGSSGNETSLREKHLNLRLQTEADFFSLFNEYIIDKSNPLLISKGEVNDTNYVNQIIRLNPDLIIAYGCSIIKSELLDVFKGRFINIHLGLSPYYRGSATNYWPFVNNELPCIGVTFMQIDAGIDTGEIIHQQRAFMHAADNIHTIGCRLIKDMTYSCARIIDLYPSIIPTQINEQEKINLTHRYYRKKDFTENSVALAYQHLQNRIIEIYLENKSELDKSYPLVSLF